MSNLFLLATSLLYLCVAVSYLLERQYELTFIFINYALANLGFIALNYGQHGPIQ